MNLRGWVVAVALAAVGCGVPQETFDAKAKEADESKAQVGRLQSQLASDESQIATLKSSLGRAQSQAMTDEQKGQLDEAKRAVEEAQQRGKLVADLEGSSSG